LDTRPGFGFPPLECCRGTSPIQAASSRTDLNVAGSAMVAEIADAVPPRRSDDAEPGQVATQCIDEHDPLPDQQITRSMVQQRRLLIG